MRLRRHRSELSSNSNNNSNDSKSFAHLVVSLGAIVLFSTLVFSRQMSILQGDRILQQIKSIDFVGIESSFFLWKTSISDDDDDSITALPSTSILITSNLIPIHPSISMINETIHSLHRFIDGLPINTPIFVIVDGLAISAGDSANKNSKRRRWDQYISNLQNATFLPLTNVHVVPMERHLYLSGSVNYTLVHHVKSEFIYVLQHDLPFVRNINHPLLLRSMRDHPDTLVNVRFRLHNLPRIRHSMCPLHNHNLSDYPAQEYNGLDFHSTAKWSDNNHISTKEYYLKMFQHFKRMDLPMEWRMQELAKENCSLWGQQVYGNRMDFQPWIDHLDGRNKKPDNRTNLTRL